VLLLEEEYMPVRDQGFRRAIVTAYPTAAHCADSPHSRCMSHAVTAAHIVPWSETHDDRPGHGTVQDVSLDLRFSWDCLGSRKVRSRRLWQLIVLDNLLAI